MKSLSLGGESAKKTSFAENDKKVEFDEICSDFINKIDAKVEAIKAFHEKSSIAKGPNNGKTTKSLKFIWTIYSTLIEGVITDWEFFLKKILMHVAEQHFDLYKSTGKKHVFGKSLADKFANALKEMEPLDIVARDREVFLKLAENIVFGRQNISWCIPDELAYVLLPKEEYENANLSCELFPTCYLELMKQSHAVKRAQIVPPSFVQEDWTNVKERAFTESKAAKVFIELGVSSDILRDIFPDKLRFMMEACAQLRHVKIHEGKEPCNEDQMTMGEFTADTFKKAALCLQNKLGVLFKTIKNTS